ncbi:MAG: glycoside hydrolase family 2 [Clostridiales bacterium]|nr:glycoside hydrolase family 2 [Clostridiales bacterium]
MNDLKTPWSNKVDTTAYPRPQMYRKSYHSLDGSWQYKIIKGNLDSSADGLFDGVIRVPFSPECLLSGIDKSRLTNGFLQPDEVLIYRRSFPLHEKDKTAILHFGAVDYECKVLLNGNLVGSHIGGYTAFEWDVSEFLKEKNILEVFVVDPSDSQPISRGKQKMEHGGIWYTPTSGIWQSVWIEYTPKTYIKSLKITPNLDEKFVSITVNTNVPCESNIVLNGKRYPTENGVAHVPIPEPREWSPEDPYLYFFDAVCGEDKVHSYFAMRKFSIGKRQDGKPCFMLNNKPYFMSGMLDQGYWSDGLYTAPSDEALIYDIKLAKACGFNTLRKHIKVEPMRWYYHCDRLGMIVWQDFINGGKDKSKAAMLLLAYIRKRVKDNHYGFYGRDDEIGKQLYYKEMDEIVAQLYNCPSIALWTPFNEGWGQFDSIKVSQYLKSLDNTRLVDHASGWADHGGDIKSIHRYIPNLKIPRNEKRPVALTEFGGYSMNIQEHSQLEKVFGYENFNDQKSLDEALEKLWTNEIIPAKADGLCASIYTQVSDVQDEINGIVTYDRQVVKVDVNALKALNDELINQ